MSPFVFTATSGSDVSDQLLSECATLFSTNYGVWGQGGPHPGSPVKMTPAKLRRECFSDPEHTVLATCTGDDGAHLGHAFATVWPYECPPGRAAWVTQLVVYSAFRRRRIATQLVQAFKTHPLFRDLTAIGLASSHPASVHVCAKYSDVDPGAIDLAFLAATAPRVLAASPVPYLCPSPPDFLRGALFDPANAHPGTVSAAFTQFYVDHTEPAAALAAYQAAGRWSLGSLPAGHEFVVVVPA